MNKIKENKPNFKAFINNNHYIDKTLLIKDIMDKGSIAMQILRPGRFGKTLALSMLKCFYDCCPNDDEPLTDTHSQVNPYKKVFESFKIGKEGNEYMDKQGKHPVIFLSFRDVGGGDWETCLNKIKEIIRDEFLKHTYLLNSPVLKSSEQQYFKDIIRMKGDKVDYQLSLECLLIYLNRFYNKKVVILIDDYDIPLLAGFNLDYDNEVSCFMDGFLASGLKDTAQYLEKGILTGVLRIENKFLSDRLDNLDVYPLTRVELDDKFGFTEEEVKTLLSDFQLMDIYEEIREWYGGYRFGHVMIYNPFSVMNFLESSEKELKPYWVDASCQIVVDNWFGHKEMETNEEKEKESKRYHIHSSYDILVEKLLTTYGKRPVKELDVLVPGKSIREEINEITTLDDIYRYVEMPWTIPFMAGYLTQTNEERNNFTGRVSYELSIPNLEVKRFYTGILREHTGMNKEEMLTTLHSLLNGDFDKFEAILKQNRAAVIQFSRFQK